MGAAFGRRHRQQKARSLLLAGVPSAGERALRSMGYTSTETENILFVIMVGESTNNFEKMLKHKWILIYVS